MLDKGGKRRAIITSSNERKENGEKMITEYGHLIR